MKNIQSFEELTAAMGELPPGPAELDTRIFACPGEIIARVITGGGKLLKVLAILVSDFRGAHKAAAFDGYQWGRVGSFKNARGNACADPPLAGQHTSYSGLPKEKAVELLRLRYSRHQGSKAFTTHLYSGGSWRPFNLVVDNMAESVNADLPWLMKPMEDLRTQRIALAELVAYKASPPKRTPTAPVAPVAVEPEVDHRQAFASMDNGELPMESPTTTRVDNVSDEIEAPAVVSKAKRVKKQPVRPVPELVSVDVSKFELADDEM